MKKLRKAVLVLTGLCLVVSVVGGCRKKVEKSAEEFTEIAEEKGFTVNDCTYQFEDAGYVEEALVAVSDDGAYQVEYYRLSDEDTAREFFNNNYSILAENESESTSHFAVNGNSIQEYKIKDEYGYSCISRVGRTCFYAVVDKEYENDVDTFKMEFQY